MTAVNKNSSASPQQQTSCNGDKGVSQQLKGADINHNVPSNKTASHSSEGETAYKNDDTTMMSETSFKNSVSVS